MFPDDVSALAAGVDNDAVIEILLRIETLIFWQNLLLMLIFGGLCALAVSIAFKRWF